LEIIRQSALMFAVSAGFMFRGEEKNCEKLGSCAHSDKGGTIELIIIIAVRRILIIL